MTPDPAAASERAAPACSSPEVCSLTHRFFTPNVERPLTLLIRLFGLMAAPARSEEVAPPPSPGRRSTPPPPPFPVTVYPEEDRPSAPPVVEARRVAARPVDQQAQQPAGDPYGFTAWLNGVRARSGSGRGQSRPQPFGLGGRQ